jgi:hypothetical protein
MGWEKEGGGGREEGLGRPDEDDAMGWEKEGGGGREEGLGRPDEDDAMGWTEEEAGCEEGIGCPDEDDAMGWEKEGGGGREEEDDAMGWTEEEASCEAGLAAAADEPTGYKKKKQIKENPHLKVGDTPENCQAMECLGRDDQDRERGPQDDHQGSGGQASQDINYPKISCIVLGSYLL